MFKYVLKRIGYMFLVLFILSIVIFMIYNLTPSNRAYTDAKADQVAMKQQLAGMSAEAQAKWFEERYEMYQISYGTETNNMILRYLRWVGLYPYADNPYTGKEGKLNGLPHPAAHKRLPSLAAVILHSSQHKGRIGLLNQI